MNQQTMGIKNKAGSKKVKLKRNITWGFMSLPAVLLVFIFCYLPMTGIILAFKDFRYDLGVFGSEWIGFKNFEFFFTSSDATRVTLNTVIYGLLFMFFSKLCSVFVALLLYEVRSKNKIKAYQTVMLMPHFLSWIIIAYLVYGFLSPEYGILNAIIKKLGGEPISWYTSPQYWPFIFLISVIWKGTGMSCILYYATLMGIDSAYFEAAELDGATKFQKMRYISVPFLVPILILEIILGVGNIFRADFGMFYQVPRDQGALYATTDVIDTYIFRALRESNDIGLSAAVGLFQSVVGFILVVATNTIVKKIDPEKSLF